MATVRPIITGASNSALARRAVELAEKYNIPIIAQYEIATNLERNTAVQCIPVPDFSGIRYVDTYRLLSWIRSMMKRRGFTQAMFVAHEDHLPRVRQVARHIGITESDIALSFPTSIPYDPDSTQWWARYRILFRLRELFVRPWYRYKNFM